MIKYNKAKKDSKLRVKDKNLILWLLLIIKFNIKAINLPQVIILIGYEYLITTARGPFNLLN